jgi:hypothetical protein
MSFRDRAGLSRRKWNQLADMHVLSPLAEKKYLFWLRTSATTLAGNIVVNLRLRRHQMVMWLRHEQLHKTQWSKKVSREGDCSFKTVWFRIADLNCRRPGRKLRAAPMLNPRMA